MSLGTNYHEDIFNAIHRDGHRALVHGRTQCSADITNRYGVSGTPAPVVNGKHLTAAPQ